MQPQSNKVDLPNILSLGKHCNIVSLRPVFMALRRVFGLICGHVRSRGHLSSSVVEFCKNIRKTGGRDSPLRACVLFCIRKSLNLHIYNLKYTKNSACGGPPTGSRLKRRAASGGPLRGGLLARKKTYFFFNFFCLSQELTHCSEKSLRDNLKTSRDNVSLRHLQCWITVRVQYHLDER